MVDSIRHIELAIGNGMKQPAESEKKNWLLRERSIIASKKIIAGEVFTDQNLTVKRPGNGVSP
jgi:N,N'-diacetyllegionaminate synthase